MTSECINTTLFMVRNGCSWLRLQPNDIYLPVEWICRLTI